VLFRIGQQLIDLYLGQSSVASSYGAAGSVMILLLWVYYSCQILLLGAEFTRVHAEHRGTAPEPKAFANQSQEAQSGETSNPLDVTEPTSGHPSESRAFMRLARVRSRTLHRPS
jgi:membrane protein